MKKRKKLLVGIKSDRAIADDVIRAWRRAEKGLSVEEPAHRLYFEDLATLLKVLSPKRMELLQALREIGPSNIRRLALELRRDYKNVYSDVKELLRLGLVKSNKGSQIFVPWDLISAEFPLLARAN